VVAPDTGHIATHEAGAIERGGHKVMTLEGHDGKLRADQVDGFLRTFAEDDNRDHMVAPAMVYVSQPTEYGTLYTLDELEALSGVCHTHGVKLYVDGARLAYALACDANDVTLRDLARLADAFYIGGTKCGALLGEAVVFPNPNTCPRFFTLAKQHGAAVVSLNHLCQSLNNGTLTYTRFANQYGIVLFAATQDFNNTLNLALATHTRIKLTIGSSLCQVGTKAIQHGCLRVGLFLGCGALAVNIAVSALATTSHLKLLFLLVGQSYAVVNVITYVRVLRRKQYSHCVVVCHIVHF
jgi:hypothetical protein